MSGGQGRGLGRAGSAAVYADLARELCPAFLLAAGTQGQQPGEGDRNSRVQSTQGSWEPL